MERTRYSPGTYGVWRIYLHVLRTTATSGRQNLFLKCAKVHDKQAGQNFEFQNLQISVRKLEGM